MSWIIGDIHGCSFELAELLRRLPKHDPLVFLGDYVDRGPDSSGVIARLLRETERSVFLMGNHEDMLLEHMRSDRTGIWNPWLHPANGGAATLRSYGLDQSAFLADLPAEHRRFLDSLQLYHEGDSFIAVHAGIRVAGFVKLADQEREDLLWIRGEWLSVREAWTGKTVFYGHTPSRYVHGLKDEAKPIEGGRSRGIDTGCVYGGFLTAANSETGELIQVAARKAYSR